MTHKQLVSMPPEITENKNIDLESPNNIRRPRTSEDFYEFCTTVLNYENYEALVNEEIHSESTPSPQRDGSESSINSELASSSQKEKKSEDEDSESFNLVTCFCGKPFAGRPMIECLECLTWIHLSCARIKKNNIPEVFLCAMCKKKRSASPITPPDKKRPRKTL
ncbi:PHD finger protein 13-like [Harmonia axyridis]|uniref:PHD finger protein 13-like n=1 Tax=Harmonia axyridis TaxID=115357 RepID=UPI001E2765CF|nr:PHD finger protein 13-like [Harmonia axyridis]